MSKVLDKQYIDSHFKGETWLVMTHILEQNGVPITTNKIAEDTGIARSNVASRLCAMRIVGAVTSTVNPDNHMQFLWTMNPTIPTRYKKRTKVKTKVKVKAKIKAEDKVKTKVDADLERAINAWGMEVEKMRETAKPRVVEVVPIKPKPEKGKIGVLLELIDAWKIPYAEATEILQILTKREQ
jgi:hypothetical protein